MRRYGVQGLSYEFGWLMGGSVQELWVRKLGLPEGPGGL